MFKGHAKTSLIDFPGHLATVLFTGGCNFRCPMCHNADLVLHPHSMPTIPEEYIYEFLEERRGKLTGITITGGEPTLHPKLIDFIFHARDLGYAIKLDTNGYNPGMLEALLTMGALDYVAMDVKAPIEKYQLLTGIPDLDVRYIEQSIAILSSSNISYELRTTVVPDLLETSDIISMAYWLSSKNLDCIWYLQPFRPGNTLDPTLTSAYSVQELHAMATLASEIFPAVSLRGM